MERIIVENVSKKFRLDFGKNQTGLVSFFSAKKQERIFWALNNISFNANAGETVGLIGKNGSGKSTLLRIIAGIYKQDKGKVYTSGKIISHIGHGMDLKNRLTMKDNIFLIGSLYGLNRKEIRNKFDSIVNFTGLENFVYTKLYQFSDGMVSRVIFSSIIHFNPEILLLDEVSEGGDKDFKAKCSAKIKEMVNNGGTAIFVSHEMELIKKYCNRVIWLENGTLNKEGSAEEIIGEYLSKNNRNESFYP